MAGRDFDYWWNVAGEWVEEPNRRRKGWSGMMRVLSEGRVHYVKRQLNHLCRTWRHPFGWPTTSREWHYLKRLRELGIGAPSPVFHGVRRTPQGVEAVLVTEDLTGYADLTGWRDLPADERGRMATVIGEMLGRLHGARLQHSCLYDKHVMVRRHGDSFEAALIDLEKMRPRLTTGLAAGRDLEQFRRRQGLFGDAEWGALLAAHARTLSVA